LVALQDAEEDAADDEDDDEDTEEDGGRNHRYTLRDRSKVQVQPYVPGMGGGMLKRPGCAESLSAHLQIVVGCTSLIGQILCLTVPQGMPRCVQCTPHYVDVAQTFLVS